MSLVYAKCLPMLTYAVSAKMLKQYECSKLDNCLDLFLAKIYGTFNKIILRNCLYYTGYLPVSLTVALIKINFLKSFLQLQSYNNKLFYLLKSVSQDDLSTLMASYKINFYDSSSGRKLKMWTHFESTL